MSCSNLCPLPFDKVHILYWKVSQQHLLIIKENKMLLLENCVCSQLYVLPLICTDKKQEES